MSSFPAIRKSFLAIRKVFFAARSGNKNKRPAANWESPDSRNPGFQKPRFHQSPRNGGWHKWRSGDPQSLGVAKKMFFFSCTRLVSVGVCVVPWPSWRCVGACVVRGGGPVVTNDLAPQFVCIKAPVCYLHQKNKPSARQEVDWDAVGTVG